MKILKFTLFLLLLQFEFVSQAQQVKNFQALDTTIAVKRGIAGAAVQKAEIVYLVEKEQKNKELKTIWEILPQYLPLIQTMLLVSLLVLFYHIKKKRINVFVDILLDRIRKGSALTAGPFSIGEENKLITNTEQFATAESTDKIYGNPDHFVTLFKVVTKDLKKSTKAMELRHGCIVQVTTERRAPTGEWNIAEAITFVPNAIVVKDKESEHSEKQTENESGYHLETKS